MQHVNGPDNAICPYTNDPCVGVHSPAACRHFWDCIQETLAGQRGEPSLTDYPDGLDGQVSMGRGAD